MRNTDYFKGKKAVIIGLARSGLACANLLHGLGARVFISDNRDNEFTRLNAEKLDSSEIKCELGRHSSEYVDGSDFMVISPGVDDSAQPVVWAKQKGIPVLSEIEIAWLLCPATVIAVTGSNGKTTVTTLIGKVIEASGRKAFICGNIGNPFSNVVPETGEDDFVSLEVSSFQLEHIRSFKPKISVILNFSRNHLDRYKNMEEYLEAKKRIFLNQDSSDFLISNAQDPVLKEAVSSCRAKKVFFSGENGISPNQSAVLAVASILNIEKDTCLKVFSEFKGLEHRLEYVAEIGGVKFINDSKATTVESCVMALIVCRGRSSLSREAGIKAWITASPLARRRKK